VKPLLAVSAALAPVLALAGTVLAAPAHQGNGPMYGRSTTRMPTTYTPSTSVSTAMGTSVSRGATVRSSGVLYSPARPAPVVPMGAATVSQSVSGTSTTVMYRLGATDYTVTYLPSGRYTYTMTRAAGAATSGMTTSARTYGAVGVSGTTTSARTYAVGGARGTSTSTTTSYAPTYSSVAGITTMPTTGGGKSPNFPALPALLGLALTAIGLLGRRRVIAGL